MQFGEDGKKATTRELEAFDQIAAEYADKIEIVKVNVDNEPGLAQQYGVTGIPALQVFQGGQLVKSMVGAKPKQILVNELSQFLA